MNNAELLGSQLLFIENVQSAWSQATFGSDAERGPLGPLEHLRKEAREAATAFLSLTESRLALSKGVVTPEFVEEYRKECSTEFADIGLLWIDAARRAGFSVADLIESMAEKQTINVGREWPKNVDANSPVEHIQ